MAKSHTTNGTYTNPEVRFERSDVEAGEIVRAGLFLAVALAVTGGAAVYFSLWLSPSDSTAKATSLPPAAIDKESSSSLPPEPRLEAIEELRQGRGKDFVIYPDRASEYYHAQRELLREGDERKGIEPIAVAMKQIAGELKARKDSAPQTYGISLPSKASSGRTVTGGQ